jgi:hypothetical protein
VTTGSSNSISFMVDTNGEGDFSNSMDGRNRHLCACTAVAWTRRQGWDCDSAKSKIEQLFPLSSHTSRVIDPVSLGSFGRSGNISVRGLSP